MTVKEKGETQTGKVLLPEFTLESGETLQNLELAYERAGADKGETVLICHALTGNQHTVGTEKEPGWWRGLINYGGYVDLAEHQTITFNVLGGCNGSTGPSSRNEATGKPYLTDFPFVSVRDMVRAQRIALDKIGITHLKAVIGGSLGGMQAYEWALEYPEIVDSLIVMAATPSLSDYGIAFNAMARKAIMDDPNWNNGGYSEEAFPVNGLSLARMVGMVTYRSGRLFSQRFHRETKDEWGENHSEVAYQVESYLLYQGDKFTKRFDPNSYLYLLKAMDRHDIEENRGPLAEVLARFKKKVLLISYESDLLYPQDEIEQLGKAWKKAGADATVHHVKTVFGHDGFLTEFDKWGDIVKRTLERQTETT
ncbi:homoserine O-acetyltransferase MetX [Evansella clarkii]|uniref:homoserine O-acetyltransferase MetX n=1 Tax=Evansella clarkii TaxID=79879 RepID=UPI000B448F78|nr:homoserine O-acetyltransferase [Evansella clarkii]